MALSMLQDYSSDDDQNEDADYCQIAHRLDVDSPVENDANRNYPIAQRLDASSPTENLITSPTETANSDNSINAEIEESSGKTNPAESNDAYAATPGTSRETPDEMSEMVIKNNIINASIHGPIDSSSVLHSTSKTAKSTSQRLKEILNIIANVNEDDIMNFDARNKCQSNVIIDSESSEDESEDSSSQSDSDLVSEWENLKEVDEDSDIDSNALRPVATNVKTFIKAKGELGLEDLPPIEDLAISVPEQECEMIGTVYDIVDQLVVIESLPNKPSLDLDTVLFLDNGKTTIGQVFDVFGQVTQPFYCVRFNSENHVKEKGIALGMPVFYAPKTDHTKFVFVAELMKVKGSDASWRNDIETPSELLEFSDDEEERRVKRAVKNAKRAENQASGVQRPSEFEERMNRRNIMKTAESNQKRRFDASSFNPFGQRSSGGNWSAMPTSEIRWSSISNNMYGSSPTRFPGSGWNQSVQPQPQQQQQPFNFPPFMRSPRFDWIQRPFARQFSAPPPPPPPPISRPPLPLPPSWTYPASGAPPPPPSWTYPSTAPPGT